LLFNSLACSGMTPTKEELIVADLVIMNIPYKQGIAILNYTRSLVSSGKFQFDEDIREKVHEVKEGRVRAFLLEQGYTEPENHSVPRDMLVEKGLKARELGGHAQYLVWEEKERRAKRIEDFPKRQWWIFEPLKVMISWIIVGGLGLISGYLIGHDTVQSTIKAPLNKGQTIISSPPRSKASNKQDTLK